MFQWPVLILTAVLFISGLSAFATAEEVKQYLSFYWSDIRQFMPVTFQGRYDKIFSMTSLRPI